MNSRTQDMTDDARTQIAQLRRQVESLMNERVTPAVANAADRAQNYAQQGLDYGKQGLDYTRGQAEALSERVRDQPLIALLLSGVVGYLLGRVFR